MLVLLDLSAAFDVIDHAILFNRKEYAYGITEEALTWVHSYLKNRKQCVVIGKSVSKERALDIGVPQGSVLCPRKYCLFSKPIGGICKRHNMFYHCYADDKQAYMVIRPLDNWMNYSSRKKLA